MLKAKYIRIFSDIHLDFDIPKNLKFFNPEIGLWSPKYLDSDKETILILAGDLWHSKKIFSFMGFSWIKKISLSFHSVLIVLGNHDFWNGNLHKEYNFIKNKIKEQNLNNVYLLQNSQIKIENVNFIGGTLWTDFNHGNKFLMENAENIMNDYKYIRNGINFGKLHANHILGEHIKTVNYINENINENINEKNWVITHHSPTYLSIKDIDRNVDNSLYASNLDYLFLKNIDVWVHGHIHECKNYLINKTKIIANPRGYVGQNTEYDEKAIFDFNGNLLNI